MRLEKCWFCSSTIYPGHGICFVRNDSKLFRFCRSKCHKNFKMKRNPRKVKWTKAYRAIHGKDMTGDGVFEFERRRHRPIKYNRLLAQKTLVALRSVEEIRIAREQRHHEQRMTGREDAQRRSDRNELLQQVHLVRGPSSISTTDKKEEGPKKIRVAVKQQSTDLYEWGQNTFGPTKISSTTSIEHTLPCKTHYFF